MDGESLISWNIPNFVSFVLMIALIWVIIGTLGHVFIRQPSKRAVKATNDNTNAAPGGVLAAA
jgi:hypothetical protein